MSKSVTIKQNGVAQDYTNIVAVRTNVESGTSDWLPQDEYQTALKRITKNGTYKASDDGKFGYYAVVANVKAQSVTGKDKKTGETIKVIVDGNGNIIKIPANSISNVT